MPGEDHQDAIVGVAPGVSTGTGTFTCPKCQVLRSCQSPNPPCMACGYQDPRRFEIPDDVRIVGGWHQIVPR